MVSEKSNTKYNNNEIMKNDENTLFLRRKKSEEAISCIFKVTLFELYTYLLKSDFCFF